MSLGHIVSYRGRSQTLPVLDGYEDLEDASGGCISASGDLDAATVRQAPGLFTFGAVFRTFIQETGQTVWGGRLLDPGFAGDRAQLTAKGWGLLPDRAADRLMLQSRYYGDWATQDSDPYGYNVAGDSLSLTAGHGKLSWLVPQGTALAQNDQNGFVFWSPGSPIGRAAFSLSGGLVNANTPLRILTGNGPSGALTQRGADVTGAGAVDRNWSADDDLICLRIIRTGTTLTTGSPNQVHITNLRVNGYALNSNDYDVFSVSDFVRFVGARLGLHDRRIRDNAQNILPYDLKDGNYADGLDYAATLVGWRWLVLDEGAGPVLEFGGWDRRTWTVADLAFGYDLQPVERYNHVRVPFLYAHGKAQGYFDAVADPNPFPALRNEYPNLSITDPLPDDTAARTFGQTILSWLSRRRFAGDATFATVTGRGDSGDVPDWRKVPSHVVHAGDTLRLPVHGGIELRIAELRRHAADVQVTFDATIRPLERFLERRQRRLALAGRA